VSALTDAKAHLAKAREFLEAAALNNDLALYNAATSNAVTSGINSKDAICLKLTGRTGKMENHTEAIAELKATGSVGRAQATTFDRLLRLKARSQYQTVSISASDATKAIAGAVRMLEAAVGVNT